VTTPPFDHVLAMSDDIGMFEHADHAEPRLGHGYCTDDVARLLIVIVREPDHGQALRDLSRVAYRFMTSSQSVTGRTRNRRSVRGRWEDRPKLGDAWGRSLWAFGTAARLAPEEWMRSGALSYFDHGVAQRASHVRSMAFAALGAAEVLQMDPRHRRARAMLADAVTSIGSLPSAGEWRWPEPRLAYANAAVAEALIAAGDLLGNVEAAERGLTMLGWLLERETVDGHLSPTPAGGAGPDDRSPAFDQQPIEVAALADACVRAASVTGDAAWLCGLDLAVAWFDGVNDVGAMMWDPATGGGYDGLTPRGPNLNQGAESTLAMIATMQLARHRRVSLDSTLSSSIVATRVPTSA
jgi:hypothetical protein